MELTVSVSSTATFSSELGGNCSAGLHVYYLLLASREGSHLIGRAKLLARILCVARYRIASKCFYAFLFRRPRGEKYRNMLAHNAEALLINTVMHGGVFQSIHPTIN